MMRKFVRVPVVCLGSETQGQFLEIMSDPCHFGGINLDSINESGLDKNIAETKALLQRLPRPEGHANLYLTGYVPNLSNTQGVNIGLLAAAFMQTETCPYQKIIVTGQIESSDSGFPVIKASYFEAKLNAIMNLGKLLEPTPFFFPRALQNATNSSRLAELETINIVLKPIDSLNEILNDFGIDI